MDSGSNLQSIETIKNQLEEVSLFLKSATAEDKERLEQLQLDLLNLLELTVIQLEAANVNNSQPSVKIDQCSNIDEQYEIFKAEIEENPLENKTKESSSLINDLLNLQGTEVRAPFVERWGGHSYHNAVVLSIAHAEENPKAIVLYSQPTSNAMVPCRFYLDEKCNFTTEKCKFSHGNEVDVSSLKDYIIPDMQSIKKGSKIISKHKGELWHKGEVDDELSDRSLFSVNCETCKTVVEVKLEDMLPLIAGDSNKISINRKQVIPAPNNIEEDNSVEFVNKQILSVSHNFGEWERHTTGIGSKLMAQMGYILGTGLGYHSDGRIDPVTTLVYPQGISLDRCRELRLAGEGRCLLDVEKHLQKEQKKAENKIKKQEQNLRKDNVFDIINNRLTNKSNDSCGTSRKIDVSKPSLQKNSVKDLNTQNMQLGTYIQSVSKEIQKLEQSKKRHADNKHTINAIDRQLTVNTSKLESLQSAERAVRSEQIKRKDDRKMIIF